MLTFLSLMNPMLYCWVWYVLTLALLWIKIPDGYQIASLEELGLWSTSQLSLWIWSICLKIRVVFLLSILWGYIPYTNTLCNKYCLMILSLFCGYMWDECKTVITAVLMDTSGLGTLMEYRWSLMNNCTND